MVRRSSRIIQSSGSLPVVVQNNIVSTTTHKRSIKSTATKPKTSKKEKHDKQSEADIPAPQTTTKENIIATTEITTTVKSLDDWLVGAHVSAAGGPGSAPVNATAIGAKSFAIFTRSQRKWTATALTEEQISTWKYVCN